MDREAAVLEVKCTPEQMDYIKRVVDEEAATAWAKCKEGAWRYEADDLRQTAWEGIAQAWDRIQESRTPGAYIRATARNAIRKYCKRLRADALGGAVQIGSIREDI